MTSTERLEHGRQNLFWWSYSNENNSFYDSELSYQIIKYEGCVFISEHLFLKRKNYESLLFKENIDKNPILNH